MRSGVEHRLDYLENSERLLCGYKRFLAISYFSKIF